MTTDVAKPSSGGATKSLRICCYGSSSSRTPEKYTSAAYQLGLLLAERGHTCVNGAGSAGCMAAMNRGANDGNGRIVGVIHEKFVVDGSDWFEGAHSVFREGRNEILIARGNDLQERKKLLVEGADALVVLPGGPGTWDELWEMACSRHIGFHSMPIVCVNVDNYYDNFRAILSRAHKDELLYKHPTEILHFEESPQAAIAWIEAYFEGPKKHEKQIIKRRSSILKRMESNLSGSSLVAWGGIASLFGNKKTGPGGSQEPPQESPVHLNGVWRNYLMAFFAGVSVGVLISARVSRRST